MALVSACLLEWLFLLLLVLLVKINLERVTLSDSHVEGQSWDWVWKANPRVKHFLWLAHQERLTTKNDLRRGRIVDQKIFEGCNQKPETTEHILRHCQQQKISPSGRIFAKRSRTLERSNSRLESGSGRRHISPEPDPLGSDTTEERLKILGRLHD